MSGVVINYQSGSRLDALNLVDESQVRLQPFLAQEVGSTPNSGNPNYPFRYQGFAKEVTVLSSFTNSEQLYLSLEDLEYSNNGITIEGVIQLGNFHAIPYTHHIIYAQTLGSTFITQNFDIDVEHPSFSTVLYTASDTNLVNVDTGTSPYTLKVYLPLTAISQATRIYSVQGLIKVWEGLDRASL